MSSVDRIPPPPHHAKLTHTSDAIGFSKDTRRRAKQQVLQTLGLAQGQEDSDFQAAFAEYKGTVTALRSLQKAMRNHLDAAKKQHETAAILTAELAAFHRNTAKFEEARELAMIHSDLERIQLAAGERLYEEECIAHADLLLWQVPEVEERARDRKKLLLDYNSHLRKFEAGKHHLNENQNYASNSSTSFIQIGKKKSESEMMEDVATRKVRMEHAEAAVEEVTEFLNAQFNELNEKKESGEILRGPMGAFVAIQLSLAKEASKRLERVVQLFPDAAKFTPTLVKYQGEFESVSALASSSNGGGGGGGGMGPSSARKANKHRRHASNQDDMDPLPSSNDNNDFSNSNDNSLANSTHHFTNANAVLSSTPPPLVVDCIKYLESDLSVVTEGLFRVPGSQETVQELKERYDSGERGVIFEASGVDAHDAAALLKLYFRDLSSPLVPFEVYPHLLEAARSSDAPREVLEVVRRSLPPANYNCLRALAVFLHRVSGSSAENKMTPANLATCFAPTLLRAPEDTSPARVLQDMQAAIGAVKIIIEQARRLPSKSELNGSREMA